MAGSATGEEGAASSPRPRPAKLGRDRDTPIPIAMAVEVVARQLQNRFPHPLWFLGEIVQVRAGSHGRLYVVLQDGASRVDVHVPPSVAGTADTPEPGSLALVQGTLRIWERTGAFRIEAQSGLVPTDSAGSRAQARKKAERQLSADGVFSRHKRPLPLWPVEVAVVSSPRGAAVGDIEGVIRRRAPWVRVRLHQCAVQGPTAAALIAEALDAANNSRADVIILSRGGGAADDLDVFDDPFVVRRVAASRLPIVVAVGHEQDSTLCDRAADLSASTPSVAAERSVPDRKELRGILDVLHQRVHMAVGRTLSARRAALSVDRDRMEHTMGQSLRIARERLDRLNPDAIALHVRRVVAAERARCHHPMARAWAAVTSRLQEERRRTRHLAPDRFVVRAATQVRAGRARIDSDHRTCRALSPNRILARGYAVVIRAGSGTVRSVGDVNPGDHLRIMFNDGVAAAIVEDHNTRPSEGEAS
jgi:exodeoxyribonuclease VII large subunit